MLQRTIPRRISFLLTFLLPIFSLNAQQGCDCLDAGNCFFNFGPQESTEVCYEVAGLFQNELGNGQSVCGVNVIFYHPDVYDLELSLVSPNGTEVQLVGEAVDIGGSVGTTGAVTFNVLFLPNYETVNPDTLQSGFPAEEIWTNAQQWISGGTFGGSYYPNDVLVNGNGTVPDPNSGLESFNSGPANGEWCLKIDNTAETQFQGRIINFEVIFCDIGGLPCCAADGGEVDYDSNIVSGCQGDESLDLEVDVIFQDGEPDTTYYGYTFLFSDDQGIIQGFNDSTDLSTLSPGEYTVCGFSYLLSDSVYLDSLVGIWDINDLNDTLDSENPIFCGDLGSGCFDFTVEIPPVEYDIIQVICEGEQYEIDGNVFTETGNYTIVYEDPNGCDAVGYIDLTVGETYLDVIDTTICYGETISFYSQELSATGIYEETLNTYLGCDSIIQMNLTILNENLTELTEVICQGDEFIVGSSVYTDEGVYTDIFTDSNGCDSIVELTLNVDTLEALITGPLTLSCSETSLTLDGLSSIYTGNEVLSYEWSTTGGQIDSDPLQSSVSISQTGTYILNVSTSVCSDTYSVVVIDDVELPVINMEDIADLTCSVNQVELDATSSTFTNSGTYLWTTSDGSIVNGSMGPVLTVDQNGTYTLTLTDDINGCVAQESFQVQIDTLYPVASAGDDMQLNCVVDELDLDGTASDYLGPYTIFWTDVNGDLIPGTEGDLTPEVETAGTYIIVVESTVNNCISTDTVLVDIDTAVPVVILGDDFEINCLNPQLPIDASGTPVLGNGEIAWSTPLDGIASGGNTLSPLVQEPGEYILTYTNLDNLCSSSDTVVVSGDFDLIDVNAGFDFELDCANTTIDLGGSSQNPTDANYVYTWYNSSGVNVNAGQLFTADTADTYTMEVLDTDNGCISSDEVEVTSDQRIITASTNVPEVLTCAVTSVDLLGSYTDVLPSDVFLEYTWIDPDGVVISEEPEAIATQHGIYQFQVFDVFNFCSDTVSVEVLKDVDLPDANAGLDIALDCETGLATLSGTYVEEPNTSYASSWYTLDPAGNIVSSTDTEAVVDEEAFYYFEVTDLNNSCTYQDIVFVYLDTIACTPLILDVPDVPLNCYTFPNDTIDATNAFEDGDHIVYEWEVVEGIFVSGENTLTPDAVLGTYILTVTNTVFDLVATETVYVYDDREFPTAIIDGGNFTANCDEFENNIELSGVGSTTGPDIIYNWALVEPAGNIVSGQDSINCLINQPGFYDFTVMDTVSGCSAVRTVFAGLEGTYPDVCLDDFTQFDCDADFITVNNNCGDPNYSYFWSIDQGQLEGPNGEDSVDVSISNSPEYLYLEVTDVTNQCTSMDSIQIFGEGQCFPDCNIENPDVLTCSNTSITLTGFTTTPGSFSYSWSTSIGEFCDVNTTQPTVCVEADGPYTLSITDNESGLSCTTTIEVQENLSAPLATIQPLDSLTCYADSVSIIFDVFGADEFSVDWILADGNCEPSEFTETIYFASCGGEYGLVLMSQETGCYDTIEFEIPLDTISPTVSLTSNDVLDCLDPAIGLLSTGSAMGENFIYTYFDPVGNIIATGQDLEFATANTSGEYCLYVEDITNGCVAVDCYDVIDNAELFNVSTGNYDPLDCDNPNVVISGTSDTFGDLIYYWESVDGCFDGDANQQSVLIDCPGTYTFVAFDTITYCLDSVSVIIDQDSSLPFADAGPDVELNCSDAFITLDGSDSDAGSEIAYFWYTEDGNILSNEFSINPEVDMLGTYYLVVENLLTDCSDTSSVDVLSGENFPIADAGPDGVLGCGNSEFQVTDNTPSEGDTITYSWAALNGSTIISGSNSANPVFDTPDTYIMTVTDILNGCVSIDEMILVSDTTAPDLALSIQSNFFNCFYDEVEMTGIASTPFNGLSFFWDTTDGLIEGDNEEANITALQEGTYSLVITDIINNCSADTSIVLSSIYSEPELIYELPDELNCNNEFVVLDASASFSLNGIVPDWSGPANANIINDGTLTPSVDTAGVYQLIIKDALSLCADSVNFTVYEDYTNPTAVLSSEPVILCEVNDAVLDLSTSEPLGQLDYEWVYGGVVFNTEDSIVLVNQNGIHEGIVTDINNGCSDTLTIDVYSDGVPIDSVDFLITDPVCYGYNTGEVHIAGVYGGTPPYLYAMEDGDFASHIYYSYLPAGEHLFIVEDADGCVFEQILEITEPDPLYVDLGEDMYIKYGEVVELSADVNPGLQILSVSWDKPVGNTCATCLKGEVGPEVTTDYTIYVRDIYDCVGQDELTVFVDETAGLYIPNSFRPNSGNGNATFIPYANESVDFIEELSIFDRWGELVFRNTNFMPNDISAGWDGRMNGELLQPNVFTYMIQVRLANGELIQREGTITLVQ